jgi:hypothetical protein
MTCSPDLHPISEGYVPRDNEFDAYNWSKYDPEISAGAPINLQITGCKWECERVLRAAGRVAQIMREAEK